MKVFEAISRPPFPMLFHPKGRRNVLRAQPLRLKRKLATQKTGGSNRRPPSLLACSSLRNTREGPRDHISPPPNAVSSKRECFLCFFLLSEESSKAKGLDMPEKTLRGFRSELHASKEGGRLFEPVFWAS